MYSLSNNENVLNFIEYPNVWLIHGIGILLDSCNSIYPYPDVILKDIGKIHWS